MRSRRRRPLAAALATWGWTKSFATAASIGIVLGVLLLLLVKDSPYRGEAVERIKVRALARTLGEVWGNPGTQLGLWVHFTAQFGATVFTMLWGYPFLVSGEGLSPKTASWLLVIMTLTAMAAGPLVAAFTARVPYRRSQLVLGIVLAIVTVWAVTLLWPGPAPLWLLVLLVVVTAMGGPGRWSASTWPAPSTPRTGWGARPGWSTSAASRHPWSPSR